MVPRRFAGTEGHRRSMATSLFLIAVATMFAWSQARSITTPGVRQHMPHAAQKATDRSQVVRTVIALLADRGQIAPGVRLEILPGQAGGSVVRIGRPESQFFFSNGPKEAILHSIRAETHWLGNVTLDAKQQIDKVISLIATVLCSPATLR